MTKFSIAQVSMTSLSGKFAAILLIGAGVFWGGYSLTRSWWQPRTPLITANPLRTLTPSSEPTPAVTPPSEVIQSPSPVQEIVLNEPEPESIPPVVVVEQPKARDVLFLVAVGGEEEEAFDTWEAAKHKLSNASQPLSLSLEFSPELITDHHDEAYFRAWLARVGDYIYARRMIWLGDNVRQVLQYRELGRVLAHEVEERGCVLLEKGEKWRVSIRGLEQHPEELIKVGEEIFARAFNAPDTLALCETLKEKKISEILSEMGYSLNKAEVALSDLFLQACTHNTAMRQNSINNLGAFLPLVPFEEMANLPEKEQGYIKGQKDAFFNDYYSNVVENVIQANIGKTKATPKVLQKLLNEDLIAGESYQWLANRLQKWTNDSDISSSLLRSLFKDSQRQ